ncbi:glycosyltransferase 61 family protein [Psychrobacter sp. Pi2-52]|uniref:glycosyltransferase family 61 protein n=1 Tax=Psychrobacter sp. Pi2-52 TaxID=2774133 RepID=UPI00191AEF7D|nr:glycosyltransferase 61 family protein [Psychrobacter sp. Pi2-52]
MIDSVIKNIKTLKNKIKIKRLKIHSIIEIDNYFTLEKGDQKGTSVSPKYKGTSQYKKVYDVVDIHLFNLENVYCNISSQSFITEDMTRIFLEFFPYIDNKKIKYSTGLIRNHDDNYAYIKKIKRNVKVYNNALFLGGNGSSNFYHWLIEIAPKLLILDNVCLKKHHIDTILVNECVKKNENYFHILVKSSAHLKNINIVYVDPNEAILLKSVFFLNTFNQTVYNFREKSGNYGTTTIYNKNSLKLLKDTLSFGISTENHEKYEKIFILRNEETVSKYNNRSYNQDEIFKFFEEEGFTGIYPDKLTFNEQINIFNNANFIIGPSGASWSNLVFCQDKIRAISWLPRNLENFDTYSTLAYLKNINMQFAKYDTSSDDIHSSYIIDLEDIIKLYISML